MKYMIFCHNGWGDFSYKRMLKLLPDRDEVIVVGEVMKKDEQDYDVCSISLTNMLSLDLTEYTTIVCSPYWLKTVNSLHPRYMIALLERCPDDQDAEMWNKYSEILAAHADIVGTASERIYLEQCLRREGIFLLSGESPLTYGMVNHRQDTLFLNDYEMIWFEALSCMNKGERFEQWTYVQWEIRCKYYVDLGATYPFHATISYLAATYLYLLGKSSDAGMYVVNSFEQMVLHDYLDCLDSHYRFLSSMAAQVGDLEKAIRIYAVSVYSEVDQMKVIEMRLWLDHGEDDLVKAEIFRLNEDYASAIRTLKPLNSSESKSLLRDNYMQTYRYEDALRLTEEGSLSHEMDSEISLVNSLLIRGTIHMLHNRPYEAVKAILTATTVELSALQWLTEMSSYEESAERMLRSIAYES
ncbi:hypothetical protein [Paenibacillus antarcticus]|uniref:Uncharacterized protein n=1 Tax=Paenibacillus antarcticus TaxID=253703 RepID=A0A168PS39_9BACL|nr:hypothetical protein [Paenibacillus antarcticus]OAB47017.1 hypothetical protein PBAT_08105 [Paenibacillus antarcticus]